MFQTFVSSLQRLLDLNVVIDDVNDNPPVFSSPTFKINVSENVQVGSVIGLNDFLAQDKDLGKKLGYLNGVQTNKVLNKDQIFISKYC